MKLHGGTVVTLDPRHSDDKTQHNVMKQFSGSALQLYVHDIAAQPGWQPGDLVNFLLTALGSLSSVLQPTWLWQNNVVSKTASFNCLQKLLKFTIFFAMWYAFLCVSCVLVLVSTHGLLYSTFDFICGSTFILWSHKTSFI